MAKDINCADIASMKIAVLTLFIICLHASGINAANRSRSYEELIASYERIAKAFPENSRLIRGGKTDSGRDLHLMVLSDSGNFDVLKNREKKIVIFILNGIHPGEPDGMDASVEYAEDLLNDPKKRSLLKNVTLCIVPVFNTDGSLTRGCCSRANQNGPEQYGFRGNARNLDLNRDFMKTDAANTRSLISLLRKWDPDVFIDTHVSDGADYQYTLTLIASQHSKMNPVMSDFMKKRFTPELYDALQKNNFETSPYVDTYDPAGIPDSGLVGFFETPRFTSGYQNLYNCFSFITETHMLKPFDDRLQATKTFIDVMVNYCFTNAKDLKECRNRALINDRKLKYYHVAYELDTTKFDMLRFKGYTAGYRNSEVSGTPRLYFDHSKPFEKPVRFYDYYRATDSIAIPDYYVLPQAWNEVIERMNLNGVKMIRLNKDSALYVKRYHVAELSTVKEPYEGHYLHYSVKTQEDSVSITFHEGDYLIPVRQKSMRYIIEALEPRCADSYFAWGFFDSILQQKEWFSPYVFEDVAAELLKTDQSLKNSFLLFKKANPNAGPFDQLYFIYKNSKYFEKDRYRKYPVGRLFTK